MRLEVEGLVVAWPGGPTVGPVSFVAEPGVTHLVGPNGSGKSSVLAGIATAVRRASGEVRVGGEDPERSAAARARIGYVPVGPLHPGFLTVDEAWAFMARMRGAPAWDGRSLREALDLPGDVRLDRASTGMRRKACLLAALAGDPPVLLLDETLANLDASSLATVVGILRSQHLTVVLTHHGALPQGLEGPEVRLGPGRSGS